MIKLTFFIILLIALCLKGCTHNKKRKSYRIIIRNEIIIEHQEKKESYQKEKDTFNTITN